MAMFPRPDRPSGAQPSLGQSDAILLAGKRFANKGLPPLEGDSHALPPYQGRVCSRLSPLSLRQVGKRVSTLPQPSGAA